VRLSPVFYVFLARMAVGTLIALLPVWGLRAAERHLRFQTLLALALAGGAAALYLPAIGDAYPGFPRGTDAYLSLEGGTPGLLVLFGVLCGVANALYGTFRRRAGRVAIVLAIVVGVGAVAGTSRVASPGAEGGAFLALTLGGLLGGWFMASVVDAMVLGHFYLMIRGLPVAALRRAGAFTALATFARIAGYLLVLALWGGALRTLWEREMVWSAWRVAFGFAGPMVLLWMVKDTVRLKHTQAATGLLYVAVGFALMGELAAVYLETQTGIPS
jgi:hypothetical protein